MSTPPSSPAPTSYKNTPNRSVSVRGVTFVYRQLGPDDGVPLILLNHLSAVLDNWDPRVIDGLAARRPVITFDNRGVGGSGGSTPDTIEAMARDTGKSATAGSRARSAGSCIAERTSLREQPAPACGHRSTTAITLPGPPSCGTPGSGKDGECGGRAAPGRRSLRTRRGRASQGTRRSGQ